MGTFAILFQKDYLSNIKIYMALKKRYWVATASSRPGWAPGPAEPQDSFLDLPSTLALDGLDGFLCRNLGTLFSGQPNSSWTGTELHKETVSSSISQNCCHSGRLIYLGYPWNKLRIPNKELNLQECSALFPQYVKLLPWFFFLGGDINTTSTYMLIL